MARKRVQYFAQGDAALFNFDLTVNEAAPIEGEIEACEFMFQTPESTLSKTWKADEESDITVTYDEEAMHFVIPLTQEETMGLTPGAFTFAYRVKFKADIEAVTGQTLEIGVVMPCRTKEVL